MIRSSFSITLSLFTLLVWSVWSTAKDPTVVAELGPCRVIEAKWGAGDRWIDLSDALRSRIEGGQIDLPSLKPVLDGVDDPAPGQRKSLVVVYEYRDRVRLKIVATDGPGRGKLLLPEVAAFRVRAFVGLEKNAVLDHVVWSDVDFDFESNDEYSLTGQIVVNEKDRLHFKGSLRYSGGLMDFDSDVTVGKRVHASGGSIGGGGLAGYLIFDRVDPPARQRKAHGKIEKDDLKRAVAAYASASQAASRQYAADSQKAGAAFMSKLKELQKESANSGRIFVVAAYYGQNISWLDVTDKVRGAVGKQQQWSTTVQTSDWGEPAPGFGAPRTLLVTYLAQGKLNFKAVYQGHKISLP